MDTSATSYGTFADAFACLKALTHPLSDLYLTLIWQAAPIRETRDDAPREHVQNEAERWLQEPNVPRDTDILQWWADELVTSWWMGRETGPGQPEPVKQSCVVNRTGFPVRFRLGRGQNRFKTVWSAGKPV